jgi:hypothetical protein
VSALINRIQRISPPAATATCNLQRLQSRKTGITAQKEVAGENAGSGRRIFFLKFVRSDRSLAAALRSSDQQYQQQPSGKIATDFSKKKIRNRTPIKSQVSQRRLGM